MNEVVSVVELVPAFRPFPKIARLDRDIIITEKLDGTNALVHVDSDLTVRAGSRNRWLTAHDDNFAFASWVEKHADELRLLGPGYHYGEWWGVGIQRSYGLNERRFSLFNVSRWRDDSVRPSCCHVVPELYVGTFGTAAVERAIYRLRRDGSLAVPGFMEPEGICIFHGDSGTYFKKTLANDAFGKGAA